MGYKTNTPGRPERVYAADFHVVAGGSQAGEGQIVAFTDSAVWFPKRIRYLGRSHNGGSPPVQPASVMGLIALGTGDPIFLGTTNLSGQQGFYEVAVTDPGTISGSVAWLLYVSVPSGQTFEGRVEID